MFIDALLVLLVPLVAVWIIAGVADVLYARRLPTEDAPVLPGTVGGCIPPVRFLRSPETPPTPTSPAPAVIAPVLDLPARRETPVAASTPVTVTDRPEVAA